MKIIGIVPKQYGSNEVILQATPDEVRMILGKRFDCDFPDSNMRPGVEIDVRAIAANNRNTFDAVDKLKDLPQTLRALADILTREVKVLSQPAEEQPAAKEGQAG